MGDAERDQNGIPTGQSSAGKWTVILFLAADNALSPFFVDQLKSVKTAGFHKDVDVVVYFDPKEKDTPTKIYNVNQKRKAKTTVAHQIGDGADSYVHNLIEDIVELPAGKFKHALENGEAIPATEALSRFIDYCLEHHKADHYVLCLVGHGVIVGNDAFLPDEYPKSGIKLTELGMVLSKFKKAGRQLDILGMHSCAMSGIEVLYELKNTAQYMIASEGLSFVGSWPYRHLLKRLFNGIKRGDSLELIVESLYWQTYYCGKDFRLAGYPLEVALTSLDSRKLDPLTTSIQELVNNLKSAVKHEDGRDAIQLAHLKSQSYSDENYTDIYDFCFCLAKKCKAANLASLKTACENVIEKLKPKNGNLLERFKALIIHAKAFGWTYQYSHGLSIFFPWTEPTRQSERTILEDYKDYAFTRELDPSSWHSFLIDYFKETMRDSRKIEDASRPEEEKGFDLLLLGDDFAEERAEFAEERVLWKAELEKPTPGFEKPTGGSGADCNCGLIKNYPKDTF